MKFAKILPIVLYLDFLLHEKNVFYLQYNLGIKLSFDMINILRLIIDLDGTCKLCGHDPFLLLEISTSNRIHDL